MALRKLKDNNLTELVDVVVNGLQTLADKSPGEYSGVFRLSATIPSEELLELLPGSVEASLRSVIEGSKARLTNTSDGSFLLYGSLSAIAEAESCLTQVYEEHREQTTKNSNKLEKHGTKLSQRNHSSGSPMRSKRKTDETSDAQPQRKVLRRDSEKQLENRKFPIKQENEVEVVGESGRRRTSSRAKPKISYAALASGRHQDMEESESTRQQEGKSGEMGRPPQSKSPGRGRPPLPRVKSEPADEESDLTTLDNHSSQVDVNASSQAVEEEGFAEVKEDDPIIDHQCISEGTVTDDVEEGEGVEQEQNLDVRKDSEEQGQPIKRKRGRPRKTGVQGMTCTKCGYKSSTAVGLRSHMNMYHSLRTHTCDICFVKFPYPHSLKTHRKVHFDAEGSVTGVAVALCRNNMRKFSMKDEDLSPEVLALITAYEQRTTNGNAKSIKVVGAEMKDGDEGSADKEGSESITQPDSKTAEDNTNQGDAEGETSQASVKQEILDETVPSATDTQKKYGEYGCKHCGMILTTERYLQTHIATVHSNDKHRSKRARSFRKQTGTLATEETRLECPHCSFVCYRTQTFTRHLQSHSKPRLYKCDLCSYTNVAKGEVNRHKRNAHAEKSLTCDQCPTKFRNRILLNQHIKQKHLKVYQTMCEHCGKEMSAGAYKDHYRRFHSPGADSNRRTHICTRCGKTCRSKQAYEQHMAQHHPDTNNPEEEEVTKALLVEEGPRTKKTCGCKLCGFRAYYPRAVVKHIIQVHAERRHICQRCGAAFPREALLERHVRVFHEGLERCQCTECGRYFRSQHHLKGHTMRMHQSEFHSKCEVCGKGFYHRNALLQHMELHKPVEEREYPYHCDVCSKRFRFKSAYNKHMAEHTGNRPHVCLVCNKAFALASSLEQHLYVHTEDRPFVCSRCGKAFKMKKYLDVHMLSHASQNIVCQHCGRMFLKKEALQRHICHCVIISDTGKLEPRPAAASSSLVLEEMVSSEGSTNVFVCTNCGEVFNDMSTVPGHVCQATGVDIEPTGSGEGEEDTEGNKFICMACGAQFEEEATAHQHVCELFTVQQEGSLEEQEGQVEQGGEVVQEENTAEILAGDSENTTTIILEQPTDEMAAEVGHLVADISSQAPIMQQHIQVKVDEVTETEVQGHETSGENEMSGQYIVVHPEEEKNETVVESVLQSDLKQSQVLLLSDQAGETDTQNVIQEVTEEQPVQATTAPQAMQIYLCGICRKMFTTQEDINAHLLEHEQGQPQDGVTSVADPSAETLLSADVTGEEAAAAAAVKGAGEETVQDWAQTYLYE